MRRMGGYLILFGAALYGYAKIFNEERLTGGAFVFLLLGLGIWLFAPKR